MHLQQQQDLARQLVKAGQQAVDRQDWATALDSAGRAILHWRHWREPYALIAQVCGLRGDMAMGQSYLQLARAAASAVGPVDAISPASAAGPADAADPATTGGATIPVDMADPALYDDELLQQRMAQWCRDGIRASAMAGMHSPAALPGSVCLVAGGDVMLGRQMPGWVGLRGATDPLAGLAAQLRAADLSLVNLETCISTEGDFIHKSERLPYYYHAHPDMLEVLIQAGVTCLATGNNHAMDYGAQALAQQTDTLDACGFLHFGAGHDRLQAALPKYARVHGVTVAFIGVETETPAMAAGHSTPGVYQVAVEQLAAKLAGPMAIARAHADLVLVSPHWGANWLNAPSQAIQDSAHKLIELGADAVLGHSAHILQGVKLHLGRPIIYDMGTLLFDRVGQHSMKDSALFRLSWRADGGWVLDIRPVKLSNGRARWAAGDDFDRISRTLIELSHALDPSESFERGNNALRLRGQPTPSPMRRAPGRPAQWHFPPAIALALPAGLQSRQSNLVHATMPAVDGRWSEPLRVNQNLTILGARSAGTVRPGRGFVSEVYFQASAPAMPSRVEARLAALRPDGSLAFSYTHPVAEGIHPPQRWQPDQIICDRVVVRPLTLVEPGRYTLCWSLVDHEGGLAMPHDSTDARLRFGQVVVGELVVSATAPAGVAGLGAAQPLVRASADPVPATPMPTPLGSGHRQARRPKLASADNPLLLDAATIARVTGGTWHRLAAGALLTGVSFNRHYLTEGSAGNLFFAIKSDVTDVTFDAASVAQAINAVQNGAAAVVVPTGAKGLPSDMPLLRVEHLLTAIEQLGVYVRDHLFTGKRLLVSGTEGKTGFKNMLHHALSPQLSTHAVTNSANLDFAILGSLASIRRNDRVAIIEAAGTHPGRLAERSALVKPHLFVLTEVGNEHLDFHGCQQAVIEAKADIVAGLVDGGYGLLNADSRNYPAVRRAVLARRRLPLLLFGSAPGCNGRLLAQHFDGQCWQVSADIEGQRLQYTAPVLGEHIPLATVSVLLAAYYLGADVRQAAADLADYPPYETQGVLRRIAHQGGEVLCYDNASRASVLGYQSALRMTTRLHPPAQQGKKVGVIGQMVFLGHESEQWHAELADWVAQANFDHLILVGKLTDVTYAHLPDPSRVVQRFADYDRHTSGPQALRALLEAILAVCQPGDLLFVKGELDELGAALRKREISPDAPPANTLLPGHPGAPAASPPLVSLPSAALPAASAPSAASPPVVSLPSAAAPSVTWPIPSAPAATLALPAQASASSSAPRLVAPSLPAPVASAPDLSVLADLQPLALHHLPSYHAAMEQSRRSVWQHYFAFIYLLGQTPGHRFLLGEDAGSLCLYLLREKKDERSLSLFALPMPMQAEVLERCIARVKAFGRAPKASLFRVDAADADLFRGRANTRIVTAPQEYIYAPASYADLSGNKKRNLRRAIQSVQQIDTLEVLDYAPAHASDCEQVMATWASVQRHKYSIISYGGFSRACLKLYEQFERRDLFGKVIRIDGKIRSFGFAGEMRPGMGNLFITYSDLRVKGLNKFLYYCLLREMAHLEFANAAHAGDTPGLAFAKQALGPAWLHQPYQIYTG